MAPRTRATMKRRAGGFVAALLLAVVTTGRAGAGPTPAGSEPEGDVSAGMTLAVTAERQRLYPGEAVPVTVRLSYPSGLTVRDIQYPRMRHAGLVLRETGPPVQAPEERDGSSRTTLLFSYLVSGRKTGDYTLGPVTLDCSLLIPATAGGAQGFFGETVPERQQVTGDGVTITVVPFPPAGRPADFRGGIGDFRLAVTATPRELPPGSPVTVTIRIEGEAGLETVSCPAAGESADFTAYPPQARQEKGAVVCEQVLLPKHPAVTALPPVRFSFFNPESAAYRTLVQGPLPVRITAPPAQEASVPSPGVTPDHPVGAGAMPAGTGRAGGETMVRHLMTRPLFWMLVISCAAVAGYGRLRRRTGSPEPEPLPPAGGSAGGAGPDGDGGLEAVREAFAAGDSARFYDAAFRTLQQQAGELTGGTPRAVTAESVATVLESMGGDRARMASPLRELFAEIDRVRYGGGGRKPDREKTLRDLEEIINFLEKIQRMDIS